MAKTNSRLLLITANVGSIFEDPERMLSIWLREFLAVVKKAEPELLAIHCQEVGGKNYEESMQHVNKFITMLLDSEEMEQFDRARIFLDEDFTAVEKFTALGSLYFIHRSVRMIEIFDFQSSQFVPVEGKELLTGNIEHVSTKEKAKFAKEFFPDFVWSRKGFIRTRWNLYNTKFDLVNIHLIHDVSNVSAMETSPSTYSKFRERALLHTIERFETDQYEKYPFFIFGDFNFRMDTHQLIKDLMSSTEEQRITGKKNEVSKVLFKQADNGNVLLTVGKKDFKHLNHNVLFSSSNAMRLLKFDNEPEACRDKLYEYDVTFPPSYPFSEDAEDGTSYMPTRCPGWCDRIMMSFSAKSLIENSAPVEYRMIGTHICMGDHKPIYLDLKIRNPPVTLPEPGNHSPTPTSDLSHPDGLTANAIDPLEATDRPAAGGKRAFRPVISINGEEVEGEINIHDYTTFEQEDIITERFFEGLKRRAGSEDRRGAVAVPDGLGANRMSGKQRFKGAVSALVKSDSVLKALKHYSHRSDSETDDTDSTVADDQSPQPSSALEDWASPSDDSVLMSPEENQAVNGENQSGHGENQAGPRENQISVEKFTTENILDGSAKVKVESVENGALADKTKITNGISISSDDKNLNSNNANVSIITSSSIENSVTSNKGESEKAFVTTANKSEASVGQIQQKNSIAKAAFLSGTPVNKDLEGSSKGPVVQIANNKTNLEDKKSPVLVETTQNSFEKPVEKVNEGVRENNKREHDVAVAAGRCHDDDVKNIVAMGDERQRLINTPPQTKNSNPTTPNKTSAGGKSGSEDGANQRLVENSDSKRGRSGEGSRDRPRVCGCCKTQ